MTRARESGAYLGGIGTMLGETRSCNACGGVHESRPYGLRHQDGTCPAVVSDDFALVHLSDHEIEPFATLRPTELVVPFSPDPARGPDDDVPRGVEVPWLRPPDLSGVI